jgi:hypothetical protein
MTSRRALDGMCWQCWCCWQACCFVCRCSVTECCPEHRMCILLPRVYTYPAMCTGYGI